MKVFNTIVAVLILSLVVGGCLPKSKKPTTEEHPPVTITPQTPKKPSPPPPPPLPSTTQKPQTTTVKPPQPTTPTAPPQPTTVKPPTPTRPSPPTTAVQPTTAPTAQKVFGYRVQVFAFKSSSRADQAAKRLKRQLKDQKVYVVFKDGYYKVHVGNCISQSEAQSLKARLRKMGYSDAFVVKTYIEIQ